MFDVNFHTISKNTNSTAQPAGQGTVISCILKKPSSIVAPVLQLQLSAASVPSWNYAYISAFSRYYFINNWTAMSGCIWEADLSVDVLASYKSVIGDTTFLIERASAASDGYLTDTEYPASQDVSESMMEFVQTVASSAWTSFTMPTSFDDGHYILSVVNGDSSGFTYYDLSPSEFRSFKNALYDSINWYDGGTMADGIKKTLADPFQYVNSCMWFPLAPVPSPITASLMFGFWSSGINVHRLADAAYGILTMSILNSKFAKHPQAATRGQYLNCAPYTKVRAVFNPWGSFELDPTFIAKGYDLKLTARIDYVSGEATLYAESVSSGTVKDLLYVGTAMFGVPIPVNQRSVDISGLGGVVGGYAQAAGSAALGSVGGIVSGAAQMLGGAITTAVSTVAPRVQSKGSQGSLAALTDPYKIYVQHFPITAEDNARQGRPLMQNYKPSALSGFMKIVNPAMSGNLGTLGERQQVLSYLSGGFYYE